MKQAWLAVRTLQQTIKALHAQVVAAEQGYHDLEIQYRRGHGDERGRAQRAERSQHRAQGSRRADLRLPGRAAQPRAGVRRLSAGARREQQNPMKTLRRSPDPRRRAAAVGGSLVATATRRPSIRRSP